MRWFWQSLALWSHAIATCTRKKNANLSIHLHGINIYQNSSSNLQFILLVFLQEDKELDLQNIFPHVYDKNVNWQLMELICWKKKVLVIIRCHHHRSGLSHQHRGCWKHSKLRKIRWKMFYKHPPARLTSTIKSWCQFLGWGNFVQECALPLYVEGQLRKPLQSSRSISKYAMKNLPYLRSNNLPWK